MWLSKLGFTHEDGHRRPLPRPSHPLVPSQPRSRLLGPLSALGGVSTKACDRSGYPCLGPERAFAAYLETGSLRDAYRQRSGNEKATPSHRRDSQSASRHAAIREQRQRLREHLIHPGVLARTSGVDISGNAGRPPPATQEALMSQGGPSVRQVGVSGSSSGRGPFAYSRRLCVDRSGRHCSLPDASSFRAHQRNFCATASCKGRASWYALAMRPQAAG